MKQKKVRRMPISDGVVYRQFARDGEDYQRKKRRGRSNIYKVDKPGFNALLYVNSTHNFDSRVVWRYYLDHGVRSTGLET